VGRSPAGWQFRQRGLVITFAASVKIARERAAWSPIEAKLDESRSPVPAEVCANKHVGISAVVQTKKDTTGVRMDMALQEVIGRTTSRSCKSSFLGPP
jgi:hypothetical protein